MQKPRHFVLFGKGLSAKSRLIQNLLNGEVSGELAFLKGVKGALFSNYTLEKYLHEDVYHDDQTLAKDRSLLSYSSGEQKRALLKHLLSTKPAFLVLDNAFDMLDAGFQKTLIEHLLRFSESVSILQLSKRKDNLLPFIQQALVIENDKIVFSGSVEECQEQFSTSKKFEFRGALPPPPEATKTVENPLIQFKRVSVSYGENVILKAINWTIKKGDFWQLKGPNGAGKTTLLTMITGDNPKAYGQDIVIFGKKKGSGESIWEIKKNIGYITPSMTTLFRGWNTVEKMVISGLVDSIGLYKKPTGFQRQIAEQWIELMGMSKLKHARFSTLSEGQQCMVLIARAMIKHPPLLILDEPAHGLDDYNASMLTAFVNKIATEGQTTIVYVSHRKEPGLEPRQIFELIPGEKGSTGVCK